MSINATMTWAVGATTVTLPAPAPGYTTDRETAQSIGRTAAGVHYVYDKNVTQRVARIMLVLTAAQKTALLTFIDSTLDGAVNTFTWTDHHGTAHTTCRLLNPHQLNIEKTPGGRYRVELSVLTTDDLV